MIFVVDASVFVASARRAAQIAIVHHLRGADAVYTAVAEAFNAALITWDQEMLERCPAAVSTLTPAVWFEQQTT
jgi:predicted nucleic acid-binding protein